MEHIHAALAVVAAVSTIRCTPDEDKTTPDPVDKPYPSLILLLILSLSVSHAPELSSTRRRHPRGHCLPGGQEVLQELRHHRLLRLPLLNQAKRHHTLGIEMVSATAVASCCPA
ncbi:hypothetical protein VPH35_019875 [Triticum aestivum]